MKLKTVLKMLVVLSILVPTIIVSKQAEAQSRVELRCGWFSNPTPANAWLIDSTGEWTVGIQGGYQADGNWPDIADNQWIKTNGHYGYGCACIRGRFDRKMERVTEIRSSYGKRLSSCRNDRALRRKEPK